MIDETRIETVRVMDAVGRHAALQVLCATYQQEKGWISDAESQFPLADLKRHDIDWFVARLGDRPVGMVRVLYDPPLLQYAQYRLKFVDAQLDVETVMRQHRIAEVGRFAVETEFRGNVMLAATLMRAATEQIVARNYTHVITDVFEDDPHSPLGFHTRVMGFRPVATHDEGELNCKSRRITLLLDLKASYRRLKSRGNWIFRYLTARWPDALHHRLAA
jgi:hypothetical protein